MSVSYVTPGVYREEIFLRPEAELQSGIPAFVGWFSALDPVEAPPFYTPVPLHRKEEFTDHYRGIADGYLEEAVIGFFENGGRRCYVVRVGTDTDWETALTAGIQALETLTDIDLVAVPDAMRITYPEAIYRVQQAALDHCAEQGDRLAVLDALQASTTDVVIEQRQQLTRNRSEPLNGALYYPWLQNRQGRFVPPCGHVAGIIARTDRASGVFKAPANAEVFDAVDLAVAVDNAMQGILNPEGINCLRAFRGRGIRLWGARTLNHSRTWRYVNVRRLFLMVGRWIDLNMQWAAFEPNSFQLWVRIRRELGGYLLQLFQQGALQGVTPEQAFYVKCDVETNPPEVRDAGLVITEVGLAANAPAEFIVLRITQQAGTTTLST